MLNVQWVYFNWFWYTVKLEQGNHRWDQSEVVGFSNYLPWGVSQLAPTLPPSPFPLHSSTHTLQNQNQLYRHTQFKYRPKYTHTHTHTHTHHTHSKIREIREDFKLSDIPTAITAIFKTFAITHQNGNPRGVHKSLILNFVLCMVSVSS